MALFSALNQLPDGIEATLNLIDDLDQCFLAGFANLSNEHLDTLNVLQRVFTGTPLQQSVSDACNAIQSSEYVEKHFAVLACARASLHGSLFDTLQQHALVLLGRTEIVEVESENNNSEVPAHLKVWLDSVRHWLMEIALVGYARLEVATLLPFMATLESIQGEALLWRQAAILTGYFNELMGAVPIADNTAIPIYRWVDLWTQLMVGALQPTSLPKPKLVSGNLEVLGMDLRHHANVVSFTAYGLLSHDAQTQLVRITQSAYKVDVISGEQTWLLFNDAAPLLNAFALNQGLRLDNIPLLPTGDLLYSGQGKVVSDYNLMNKASAFFTDHATNSFVPCVVAPSARHPIQLAEPIFLSNYKVDNGSLSWGDGGSLAIATKRISSLSELNIETISKSSQMFGLLRFDAGQWSVQPLAVTVQKKTIFTGQNAAKIIKSPPKTSVVGMLQERASRLLRG